MAPEILLPSIQHKIGIGGVGEIRRCGGWFLPVGIRFYLSGFRLCILLQHPAPPSCLVSHCPSFMYVGMLVCNCVGAFLHWYRRACVGVDFVTCANPTLHVCLITCFDASAGLILYAVVRTQIPVSVIIHTRFRQQIKPL